MFPHGTFLGKLPTALTNRLPPKNFSIRSVYLHNIINAKEKSAQSQIHAYHRSKLGSRWWHLARELAKMEGIKVSLAEISIFIVKCMESVGSKTKHAQDLADVLVAADYRGHYSHGLNRLEMYVRDVKLQSTATDKEPEILQETVATACVKGNNLLGPVVGKFCMDLAIKKAKQVGIGWVVARGSNHFGIAGWYSMRAVEQGLIGMSFTNASPLQVPTRAKTPTLGTNPLSIAAPAKGEDYFMLDMATTAVALGKIEIQHRKGEPIPEGWAMDANGKITQNAGEALAAGALMPLGGAEMTSGYKGYGLGLAVEVLCGVLSGSAYGPHIRKWTDYSQEANLGQCFVAIDPNVFATGFEDRLSHLLDDCRNLTPAEEGKKVMVHGDPERNRMIENDKANGVTYHINQIKACHSLADSLNLPRMKTSPEI